jgi:hypothetical protein
MRDIGNGPGVARPDLPHRPGFRLRLAVALLALGLVTPLVAPNQSWASSPVARHEALSSSAQSHRARQVRVPRRATVAAPGRPDVRSAADNASVLILLVLTLNSAVMLIRVTSSPPTWMKD